MLATVAEEGRAKSKEGKMAIKEYMRVFKENRVENIILGCTHYPIYIPIIKEELGYDVNLINTGETVAKYIKDNFTTDKNVVKKRSTTDIFNKAGRRICKYSKRHTRYGYKYFLNILFYIH